MLYIAVDWSARSTPSPKRPSADACWIAWGTPADTPPPEYFRTRAACEARIADLIRTHNTTTLVGFDFPLGYPRAHDGTPALPESRDLLTHLADRITDTETNANNRFEFAAQLNAEIADRFDEPQGPFWGCPANFKDPTLLPTKTPVRTIPEFRAVERHVRTTTKLAIQSAWKLYTTGSVGSQALLGLPAVHRLMRTVGSRARLWPFEPIDPKNAPTPVIFAEIWPSLTPCAHIDHDIKDARQVTAVRNTWLREPPSLNVNTPSAPKEGWILGVPAPDQSTS
ncbi:MAG: hypothetical protein AAF297_11755 [Planctomycetota bacterium]